MPKIKWDDIGSRKFHTGVRAGVFYPEVGPGVPWNGLVSVEPKAYNADIDFIVIEGYRHSNSNPRSETDFVVSAFTYPKELDYASGNYDDSMGLEYTNQYLSKFGFSYQTIIGNDVEGTNLGKVIHVVYNAVASPTLISGKTIAGSSTPLVNFSWEINTTPLYFTNANLRPTAYLKFDSTKINPQTFKKIESILYGTTYTHPRLPTIAEISNGFKS